MIIPLIPSRQDDQERGKSCARALELLSSEKAVRLTPGGSKSAESIRMKWRDGLGLQPYRIAYFDRDARVPFEYQLSGTLSQADTYRARLKQIEAAGYRAVAVPVLCDNLHERDFSALLRALRIQAVPVKLRALAESYLVWYDIALRIASKAGATPWVLTRVPRLDEGTLVLGVDMGHRHKRDAAERKSSIHVSLIGHNGLPLQRRTASRERELNEALSDADIEWILRAGLDAWPKGEMPRSVIVHRDGKYFEGEVELFQRFANQLQLPALSLVAIKKSTCSRIASQDGIAEVAGLVFHLEDHKRAILVTNAQANDIGSMPRPIEIELAYTSAELPLSAAVSQVFWLSRAFQGSLNPRRLPISTLMANNQAGTGRRIHTVGG